MRLRALLSITFLVSANACAAAHEANELPDAGTSDAAPDFGPWLPDQGVDAGLACAAPGAQIEPDFSPYLAPGEFDGLLLSAEHNVLRFDLGLDEGTVELPWNTDELSPAIIGQRVHVSRPSRGWTRITLFHGWELAFLEVDNFTSSGYETMTTPDNGATLSLIDECHFGDASCGGHPSSAMRFELEVEGYAGATMRMREGESIDYPGDCADGTLHYFHGEQYPSCSAPQADGSVLIVEAWFNYNVSYSCWHPLVGGGDAPIDP